MCWVCDTDEANALLVDAERVLEEANTMRLLGVRMKAQALSEQYLAQAVKEAGEKECKR